MKPLVVLENPRRWSLELEGVPVVSARDYLTDPRHAEAGRVTVFNLCRAYAYQTFGYYVSLLAEARGHRPIPSVSTLRGVREGAVLRMVSEEVEGRIRSALAPLQGEVFELSIYFGRNLARRYDALARALFNEFPMPFMRVRFHRGRDGWTVAGIRPVATAEIPEEHHPFVEEQARAFFSRPVRGRRRRSYRFDLAVLWSEDDPDAPSDAGAIRAFQKAFRAVDVEMDVLGRDDLGRVAEYDALFIRETTGVEHHTYRFARRAEQAGLVVVDDPDSIVRCTNKVFQHELFQRHGVPTPPTVIVHDRDQDVVGAVGLPCVLKKPDGAFSRGMRKVEDPGELSAALDQLLEDSDLVVAQGFTPSAFDWRIGLLGGEPQWAARYHMVEGHWQIARSEGDAPRYGRVEAVALDEVPAPVRDLALRAAGLIGSGLYGVDLKELPDGRLVVMEVNDNPNLEAGYEDSVEGAALYDRIAAWFRARLDARGGGGAP